MEPLVITNLGGPLTRKNTGDVNSGLAKFSPSWGYDPYSKPGNLTWLEQPTSILTGVIFPAMKQRTESNINYIYAIGSNNNLYRVTVNSTSNPDVDSPSVISNMGGSADTYVRGGGMTFYGSTEKIFLGGDDRVQVVNFNGSSPSVIGTMIADSPRPMVNFLGKIYFGNGANIGEIDSGETITTAAKLNPALPSGLVINDLDITPNGNYLQITASRTNSLDAIGGTPADTSSFNATDSFKFYWNGIDASYSTQETHTGVVLTANLAKGNDNYTFGYDHSGTGIFSGPEKKVSLPDVLNPMPNAVFSSGNMMGFVAPEYERSATRFRTGVFHYGQFDDETPHGLYRLARQNASLANDTVVAAAVNVSSHMYQPSQFGLITNIAGTGKIYYSTNELPSVTGTNIQKVWRFRTVPTETNSIMAGVYETQTQLFSKKIKVPEVRIYTEPLIGGNDFVIDLIGSGRSVMAGGSQRFQVATGSVATGTDMVHFNPGMAPTYALGVRITNSSVTGVANWTVNKIEVDYDSGGK